VTDLAVPLAGERRTAPSANGAGWRRLRGWFPKRVVATPPAYDHPHGLHFMTLVESIWPGAHRAEGTTFEASCYTDPLALEHLTGSWRRALEHFGGWDAPVQLRWATRFADVDSFVGLSHSGRTWVRLSVNCLPVTTWMEGGTSPSKVG
jgi:hypothetical protein